MKAEITPCLSSQLSTSLPKPFLDETLAELVTVEDFAVTRQESH